MNKPSAAVLTAAILVLLTGCSGAPDAAPSEAPSSHSFGSSMLGSHSFGTSMGGWHSFGKSLPTLAPGYELGN